MIADAFRRWVDRVDESWHAERIVESFAEARRDCCPTCPVFAASFRVITEHRARCPEFRAWAAANGL